jgi:hypothetical protein
MWHAWETREMRAYRILVEKLDGKLAFGRLGYGWKVHIEMDLKKWDGRV